MLPNTEKIKDVLRERMTGWINDPNDPLIMTRHNDNYGSAYNKIILNEEKFIAEIYLVNDGIEKHLRDVTFSEIFGK